MQLKKRLVLILTCSLLTLFLGGTPTLSAQNFYDKYNVSWWQWGFKIGANFTGKHVIAQEDLSAGLYEYKLNGLFCGEFSAYFRAGKYVFGEIGFGYQFQKTRFKTTMPVSEETMPVELRYLQIPIRAVAYLPVSELVTLMPSVGIIYQPLIQVTENQIALSKDNIRRHACYWSAGAGIKIHFITIDLAYRKSFLSYFSDRKSTKEGYFNVQIGVQM